MEDQEKQTKFKKTLLYNLLFIAICGGLFLFLLNAPEESTTRLPKDENHIKFMKMDKKAAEKFCDECHSPDAEVPLPQDHPPKYRCLFCHKR
jgi:hypothetical protein